MNKPEIHDDYNALEYEHSNALAELERLSIAEFGAANDVLMKLQDKAYQLGLARGKKGGSGMKRITEQLNEYHASRGLSGEDLQRAVSVDLDLALANSNVDIDEECEISHIFCWAQSPEGYDYWEARNSSAKARGES